MLKKLLILALFTSAAFAQDFPDEIIIQRPGLDPEGIEYDAERERFLLGSLAEGTIFAVTDDGTITPFIEDEDLISTVGIQIDGERLLVTNSDREVFGSPTDPGKAALYAYDLETGERIFAVDLEDVHDGERHFANDIAVDEDGNAYVTDSLSPVIYKVDPKGNAEVFAEDRAFRFGSFGLNGIEVHPDGYVLAGVAGSGKIYKIPLDNPEEVTEIELERSVTPDGILLDENGDLIVVVGAGRRVVRIHSDDDWASGTITGEFEPESQGTTLAWRDGELYVLLAHLNQAASQFEIVRVVFEE